MHITLITHLNPLLSVQYPLSAINIYSNESEEEEEDEKDEIKPRTAYLIDDEGKGRRCFKIKQGLKSEMIKIGSLGNELG